MLFQPPRTGPNAQKALQIIGCGDALAKVAHTPGLDEDYWYNFRIAEAEHEHSGESIAVVRSPRSVSMMSESSYRSKARTRQKDPFIEPTFSSR